MTFFEGAVRNLIRRFLILIALIASYLALMAPSETASADDTIQPLPITTITVQTEEVYGYICWPTGQASQCPSVCSDPVPDDYCEPSDPRDSCEPMKQSCGYAQDQLSQSLAPDCSVDGCN